MMDGSMRMNPGPDPRHDAAARPLYRSLRDARGAARAAERKAEMAGGGQAIGLQPEWAEVRQIATELIEGHTADAEVLAWLIEAEARVGGHAGIAASTLIGADLVRRFGTGMHPRPEEDGDDTFASLAGLNGAGREGALIQPLRLMALVPGASYGSACLWTATSEGEHVLRDAAKEAGPGAMAARLAEVVAARAAVQKLDAALTELRGPDAPPFAAILDVLDESARAIRNTGLVAALEGAGEPDAAAAAAETDASNPRPAPSGAPHTREEAFDQLLRIARWFRTTEPHSPIAASIETLVRRGRMDFVQLLEELIPDEHTRAGVLSSAGIKSPLEE
jgi:type VI secretion system protein ImpA